MKYKKTYNQSTLKSLLRYPGGKSRAVKTLALFLPNLPDSVCSPFFGGGSFELFLVNRGVRVYGYDTLEPLILFWQEAINHPKRLYDNVKPMINKIDSNYFYSLRDKIKNDTIAKENIPAAFYVLNRTSFSGLTMSGGMSKKCERLNKETIEKLAQFNTKKLLSVNLESFATSIPKHKRDFLYCDPPYFLEKNDRLYGICGNGHRGFDHESLAKLLKERDRWLLTYNDCEYIKSLYKGCVIKTVRYQYSMVNHQKKKELVIMSEDVAGSILL